MAYYLYQNAFFKNGVGKKVLRLARSNNNYPAPISNKAVCLDYYMKGKYERGSLYICNSSHIFIRSGNFR